MSVKVLDRQGRWRNKTVAFRVSPEEDEQIEAAVRLSGLTKQDYIIRRLQEKEIVVMGNPRVYKVLKNELAKVLEELGRIEAETEVSKDLLDTIELITITMQGMKDEKNAFKCQQTPKGRDLVEYAKSFYKYSTKVHSGFQPEMEEIFENKRIEPNLKLINMESVEVEQIEWLLYPFVPYGKVTIIQGDPGEGKTTMVLQMIAKLTTGEKVLPDNTESEAGEKEKTEPVNVIYQTAEDGLGDTIKPRLLAAGADCSKVLVIDDGEEPLTMLDNRLEEAIVQTKARLVVLDPIQGFLGAEVDMHRANEIRPLMKRVSTLAEKYHCAIILIGHMNKNSNGKSSYRGLGSIDFQAAARSVLIVGRVKEEPDVRVVCHVKSSLAPAGKPIAFRLDKDNGFEWIGEYDISVDDLLSGNCRGRRAKRQRLSWKRC